MKTTKHIMSCYKLELTMQNERQMQAAAHHESISAKAQSSHYC